jgi:hypothetical protein
MKKCTKCGIEKPLSEFYGDAGKKDKLRNSCKICDIEKSRKYRKNFPEKAKSQVRSSKLKIKYGIDLEDFQQMKIAQNNRCEICNIEFWDPKYTCVDHCHTTGKVRAILCHHCNTGLGMFKDSPNLLKSAQKYLKKYSSKSVEE